MKEKIFIGKWLISIFIGLVAIVIGIVGFVINYMEMGIFFLLVGTAIVFWFVAFVPHSFVFDNEKIFNIKAVYNSADSVSYTTGYSGRLLYIFLQK